MKQFIKQKSLYLVKFAVGISLVVWLLLQVDRDRFFAYFTYLTWQIMLPVFALTLLSWWVQFRRWKYLVENNSDHYQLSDLLPSFFAGFTLRLMVPGGHAEFSKIFLLPGKKRGKMIAFGMEKFFQTYIKLALVLAVLPISFPGYAPVALGLLSVLLVAYFFLPRMRLLKQFQEKQVNNHLIFAVTLVYSMLLFTLMSLQYYLLINLIHEISLTQTMHVVIYLWGAGIVPVSISGLGIREGLAVYFLQAYQIPPAHAVATSLFLFTLNTILPALVGTWFVYKRRAQFKDIRETLQSGREQWANWRSGSHK